MDCISLGLKQSLCVLGRMSLKWTKGGVLYSLNELSLFWGTFPLLMIGNVSDSICFIATYTSRYLTYQPVLIFDKRSWCLLFQSLVSFPKLKRQILSYHPPVTTPKDFMDTTVFSVNQQFCLMWVVCGTWVACSNANDFGCIVQPIGLLLNSSLLNLGYLYL